MALSDDIRDEIEQLLTFEIDLREFEDWLVQSSWNVHQDADAELAAPLAYKVELLLSEWTGGYRTENDLRSALLRLVGSYVEVAPVTPATDSWEFRVALDVGRPLLEVS